MTAAPTPDDDAERVASLRALQLLDTDPEERFERVTRVTAALFDVPVALISLVDEDRQWFKSCIGLPDREIPRSQAFCAYAIMEDHVLVVPDTRTDDRFSENPLVTGGANVRFYAGCPIRSRDGYRVGTLCILDRVPRQLDTKGRGLLDDLARWAESEVGNTALSDALGALHQSEHMAKALMESVNDGIVTFGTAGRIATVNRALEHLLQRDDLVGTSIQDLLILPERGLVRQRLADRLARQQGRALRIELHGQRSDGTTVPVEAVVTDLVSGGSLTFVAVVRDLTARREAERHKDELISAVSHELRTPLTSIRGSLGLLASGVVGELDERSRHMVDIAVVNTDRLTRLVNDILDLDRVSAGRATLDLQPCRIDELVGQAMMAVRGAADRDGIALEAACRPVDLLVDPDRMVQVLVNLLGNAIKFSPPGATVSVAAGERDGAVRISVTDSGPGIPEDRLERIFERLERVGTTDRRGHSGTGLGLTIARAIVEQHGGRIWAESVENEGATFLVVLPIAAVPTELEGHGPHRRILVVEDDRERVVDLADTFWRNGLAVAWVDSVDDAAERMAEIRPDLVVLDLDVGTGVSRGDLGRIRHPRSATPVVAFTTGGLDEPPPAVAGQVSVVATGDGTGLVALESEVLQVLARSAHTR